MSESKITDEMRQSSLAAWEIGKRAVKEAQEENRRLGLPNCYSYGPILYYELPDGTMTFKSPFEKREDKK